MRSLPIIGVYKYLVLCNLRVSNLAEFEDGINASRSLETILGYYMFDDILSFLIHRTKRHGRPVVSEARQSNMPA